MTHVKGAEGRTRTCVFRLFGTVVGYATHHLDGRRLGEIGVVGPLSSGVDASWLWRVAAEMGREGASEREKGRWIMLQAHRAFVCGDLLARWESACWKLAPGGRRIGFDGAYCNRYELWTGNLTVEGAAPDAVSGSLWSSSPSPRPGRR